jgi:hypothetical protein
MLFGSMLEPPTGPWDIVGGPVQERGMAFERWMDCARADDLGGFGGNGGSGDRIL